MERGSTALGESRTEETIEDRRDITETVLRAAGGAALGVAIAGVATASTGGMFLAMALGAAVGSTLPRFLSVYSLFRYKKFRNHPK